MCLVAHDDAASIAALYYVFVVAELSHELVKRMSCLYIAKSRAGWCRRKGEAWYRRGDHVKRGMSLIGRVSQVLDQRSNFNKRSGPAVDEKQWDSIFSGRLMM